MPEATVVTKEQEPVKQEPPSPATKPDTTSPMPQEESKEDPASGAQKAVPVEGKKPAQEPVVATPTDPPKPKVSLSKGDLELAREEVSKLLTADIRQAKEPHAKAALAMKLLDGDTSDNSARQYAMLDQARELAIKAGDVTNAMVAVGKMTKTFKVDEPLEFKTLGDLNRYVRASSGQREYLQAIVEFVRRTVQEDRFAEALQLIERADSVARKCCGKGWQKRVAAARRELETIAEERKSLEEQFAWLQENPEDRQSNLAVGQFWCFFVRDWEHGLPHLVKGSDKRIAELAEADLAVGEDTGAAELADLADRWWELAEKTKVDTVASTCRLQAAHWYAKAEPSLAGPRKLEAVKRIEEAAALPKGLFTLLGDCKPPPLAVVPFNAKQAKKHQEAWADYLGVKVEMTNSIGMKLVLIPPGEFLMNGRHPTRLTEPFYLGVYEVTQEEWQSVMGDNPSHFKRDIVGVDTRRFPVEMVSWNEAMEFCRRLSESQRRSARRWTYQLPTEAEREYACRCGTTTRFYHGDSISLQQANFFGTESQAGVQRPTPVGSYKPNAFGLFDMHGNVSEWCANWLGVLPYPEDRAQDPHYPTTGSKRVYRGGGWSREANGSQSTNREYRTPSFTHNAIGFRVAAVQSSE